MERIERKGLHCFVSSSTSSAVVRKGDRNVATLQRRGVYETGEGAWNWKLYDLNGHMLCSFITVGAALRWLARYREELING